MSKKTEKKEQFPIEFPSRNGDIKHSPIVDNTENEQPVEIHSPYQNNHIADRVHLTPDLITEIVTTEIDSDSARHTII